MASGIEGDKGFVGKEGEQNNPEENTEVLPELHQLVSIDPEQTGEVASRKIDQAKVARMSQELREYVKGDLDISPEQMKESIGIANKLLLKYLEKRSKGLSYQMIMVPYDAGVRHFRLGAMGTDGLGLSPKELTSISERLKKGGFPAVIEGEARLINATRLLSLEIAKPKSQLVIQHFPSGGPELECTEKIPVHINTPRLEAFQEAFDSGMVEGVMLGHTSYDYSEKNFPGIEKIKVEMNLHPAFAGVDFNSIPASLNPVMIKYIREVMGFKGMIMADWFEMGAIIDLAEGLDVKIPKADPRLSDQLKIFILSVHSGVTTVPGVPQVLLALADWDGFKEEHPKEYSDLENMMDVAITEMFNFIKDDKVQLDVKKLSFKEKVLFMTFNAKYYVPQNFSRIGRIVSAKNIPLFSLLQKHGAGNYDIWSRTGVMTLIQRQMIIEQIIGKKFAKPPTSRIVEGSSRNAEEEKWYRKLMGNKKFREYYDSIEWDSLPMNAWYKELEERRINSDVN